MMRDNNKMHLAAQEELAYSYADKLYRLAYARLGHPQDAEDIVQETYVKAFGALSRFKPGTNMESWLCTIMLNTIRDYMRKISRTGNTVSLDNFIDNGEALPAELISTRSPAELVEDGELGGELSQALKELPESFLVPLLLKEMQDLSYKDIAGCLNIPIGTVMSRLSRARDFLRQRLSGQSSANQNRESQSQSLDQSKKRRGE